MQIVVEDLAKAFRIAERLPGMLGAMRGLVRRRHRVVAAIVPLALTIYVPARAILGRDPLDAWHALAPAGAAFLAVSFAVWRVGVRHHASTGT